MYTYGEVCCKELAYVIMETDRSRIFRMGQQAGDPEKNNDRVQVQRLSAAEFTLARKKSIFFF